jgi:uncharacterized protein YqjF (DUF2071 family)
VAGRQPEERIRFPVLRQRWDFITFLHWRYPVEVVQRHLPPRLQVEEIDGAAWVGMTPFLARGTSLAGLRRPALPDFPETNLRTYVRTPDGKDAVWFFSLEASNRALVAVANVGLGVPYRSADMTAEVDAAHCRYRSRRRSDGLGHDIEVRPGPQITEPSELENLLTGRWRAVVPRAGARLAVPIRHEPWPLHRAEVVALEENLISGAGLPPPPGEPHVLWSPGVESVLALPRRA